jgi:tetratricopeptide (TPR) repeat protein
VIARVKAVLEAKVILLVGYSVTHDSVFVRIYHEIRRLLQEQLPPGFAVQSLFHAEDSPIWDTYDIESVIVDDPAEFLADVARALPRPAGKPLLLPDLTQISSAPRLTIDELDRQGQVLNAMLDQVGVADLIEHTDVPLLSADQVRDIEVMRAVYERLAHSFDAPVGSARIWLRQGNLEYARANYGRAEEFYRRSLEIDPDFAEAHHKLHYVLLAQGDRAGALLNYWNAVVREPTLAILPERYIIAGILGDGGLGTVYLAWDLASGPMAVKVLHRAHAQNERALALFRREAEILQQLKHPLVVQLVEVGSFNGNYYIAMEYIKGRSLRELIAEGPLSLEKTFAFISQICDVLRHVHAAGVVHRDLKPSNLLLSDGKVRLIDFGLARPIAVGEPTTFGQVAGTVGHMAPELALGQAGDARTDVYGVGSLCYELLTGRNLNQGAYYPPSELSPGLTSELDMVIEQAREANPEERYPSIDAFCADLYRVVFAQPAFPQAPPSVHIRSRVALAARNITARGWLPLLLSAAVLSVASTFLLAASSCGWQELVSIMRYAAAALVLVVATAGLARPFTATKARRLRAVEVAHYGPLLGMLLGAGCALLVLPTFFWFFKQGRTGPWLLGKAGDAGLFIVIFVSLVFSLATALIVFWLSSQMSELLERMPALASRSRAARAYLATLLAFVLILVAVSVVLPPGSFMGVVASLMACS